MGFWAGLRDLLVAPAPRSATFSGSSESPPRLIDSAVRAGWFGDGLGGVSREQALSVPAILKGRNLICGVATLPLEVRDTDRNVVRRPLFEQIDPDVPNSVTLAQTLEDLFFEGVSYWRVTEWENGDRTYGRPTHAQHIDYQLVTVRPASGRSPSPLPAGIDPRGEAEIWVEGREASWDEIIMFPGLNPGVRRVAGRTIRRAIALDATAGTYADNPRPLDFFTPAEGADPADDDAIRQILADWRQARQAGSTAYVPAALKYNTVDTPTPADLQIVEQTKQVYLELAAAMGLDPEDLGISTTSRTYQNDVSRRQDRINNVLIPYMTAIEQRLSMPDVTPRGQRVRFDLDDYLRPDPKTRAEVDQMRLTNNTTTRDEIREAENMPDLPEPEPEPTPQPEQPPAPTEQPDAPVTPLRVVAASAAGQGLTFSDDTSGATFAFETPAVAVDVEKRTITGLVVPFGKVATSNGRRWRFAPGSIQFTALSHVKLLREHDWSQALGKAVDWTETPEGIFAKFKVARGAEGDRALQLAEDGALDGLSVRVDPIEDAVPDPENRGAWLVKRSTAREVSLTAKPAFDESRVTAVAASRTEGTSMDDDATTEPQAPAAPAVAPGLTFTAEQVAALMSHGVGAFTPPQTQPEPEPRPVVNPTRSTAATFVSEPQPYRFDRRGNFVPAQDFVFSADLHEMARNGDADGTKTDAGRRVMGLLQAAFATVTTDINELNPEIQRPDMYVDQRDYRYTIWNIINKGAPPNGVNPFRFPKFNSSSGLVGDHVEGTEPTAGSFTTTSQVVNPTALSGKASITREVWDMGGNPAVSTLLFNQMRRAWFEGLEQASADFLETLTAATDITLTAGAENEALAADWDAALADLQFVRGYDYSAFVVEKTLYKKFVAARDDVGRVLFPMINPTNANGTASVRFRTLDLGGVVALPTWSLPVSGGVPKNSWLFDPTTVHGWATAPQRLEFPGTDVSGEYAPVAMIDLGIWGYKAFANSDIGGVRQVIYDSTA